MALKPIACENFQVGIKSNNAQGHAIHPKNNDMLILDVIVHSFM